MLVPSGSSELVADSEGDVRGALGGSYVDGARRHPRVTGAGWTIQEEEELGMDGGVPGLLAQIHNRNSWCVRAQYALMCHQYDTSNLLLLNLACYNIHNDYSRLPEVPADI